MNATMKSQKKPISLLRELNISEITNPGSSVDDVNKDIYLIPDDERCFSITKQDDDIFKLDNSNLILNKKLDFETQKIYKVEIKAEGNKFVPHFHRKLMTSSPREKKYLAFFLREWLLSWHLEWIESLEFLIKYTIAVVDAGTILPDQRIPIDTPLKLTDQPVLVGDLVTEGDEPKYACVEEAEAKAFNTTIVNGVVKLKLVDPNYLRDTNFQPLGNDTWLYPVTIEVSDKIDGSNPVQGKAIVYLQVHRDSVSPSEVNFGDLVSAANKIAPPKKLSEILDIDVPETTEKNLKDISETLEILAEEKNK